MWLDSLTEAEAESIDVYSPRPGEIDEKIERKEDDSKARVASKLRNGIASVTEKDVECCWKQLVGIEGAGFFITEWDSGDEED